MHWQHTWANPVSHVVMMEQGMQADNTALCCFPSFAGKCFEITCKCIPTVNMHTASLLYFIIIKRQEEVHKLEQA